MFEMVRRRSIQIQQSTASLLNFNPDDLRITIQGLDSCVALAKKEVNMILDDYVPKDELKTNTNIPLKRQNQRILHEQSKALSAVIKPSLPGELQPVEENLLYENNINKPQYISDLYSVKNEQNVDNQNHLNIQSTSADHHSSDQKSSSSCVIESDEENRHCQDVLTDPRNAKQVEQAAKLGYNLSQIQVALEELGPGSSSDDLLSELIKIGNEQSQPKTSSSDREEQLIFESLRDFSLTSNDSDQTQPNRSSPVPSRPHDLDASENLRSIVIDGSNVAMSHGQDRFSCKGIKIAVDWFKLRGHTDITVFVPQWRKEASRPDAPIEDQHILQELERERIVTFTPSRRVQGRRIVSYDDRYILKHAVDVDGIVVSNDVYRDLERENEGFRKVVEQRLLMYTFVKDKFMPPDDPLGRLGPSLDDFLRKVPSEPAPKPQDCPYGKKCTYGNKCRFYHPERGFASQKSITETLKEQAHINLQEIASKKLDLASEKGKRQKQKLVRTKSLVPGESLPGGFVSDDSVQPDGPRFKSKPKLGHSKSLCTSSKKADYLTASRLKLEEAESAKSSRKFSLADKDMASLSEVVSTSQKIHKRRKGSTDIVGSYSPSPRTSPAPPSEVSIMGGVSNLNFLPSSSVSSLSFAHLAVPSPEPQESYSSGHLGVAKKLSDEGSEKNFFEGNKLSPSPPSLLDDIAAQEDQKPVSQVNFNQQHTAYTGSPQDLSANEGYRAQTLLNTSTENDSNTRHVEVMAHCCDDTHDSGNFSMFGSPQPVMSPMKFTSYPPIFRKSNSNSGHQSLHRSLSSSHTAKKNDLNSRRCSDSTEITNEHNLLKPQQSSPVYSIYDQKALASRPEILLRQNSLSSPDIHAWTESFYDSGKSLDSGCNMYPLAPLPETVSANPSVQDQAQHIPSMLQMPTHQQNIHYNENQFVNSPQRMNKIQSALPRDQSYILPSYPSVGPAEPGLSYQMSLGLQRQLIPIHSPHGSVMYSYPCQQQIHSSAQYTSEMTNHPPFNHQSLYQGQNSRSYDYLGSPHQSRFTRPMVPHMQYKQEYPPTAYQRTPNNPVMFDQDAPIHPDDSRHATYHHLSSLFGEKVVRNFMNRNPDVKDITQLMNLISVYKAESGL